MYQHHTGGDIIPSKSTLGNFFRRMTWKEPLAPSPMEQPARRGASSAGTWHSRGTEAGAESWTIVGTGAGLTDLARRAPEDSGGKSAGREELTSGTTGERSRGTPETLAGDTEENKPGIGPERPV